MSKAQNSTAYNFDGDKGNPKTTPKTAKADKNSMSDMSMNLPAKKYKKDGDNGETQIVKDRSPKDILSIDEQKKIMPQKKKSSTNEREGKMTKTAEPKSQQDYKGKDWGSGGYLIKVKKLSQEEMTKKFGTPKKGEEFSGMNNEAAKHFHKSIPVGEIDVLKGGKKQVTEEITHEIKELNRMKVGLPYSKAHPEAESAESKKTEQKKALKQVKK